MWWGWIVGGCAVGWVVFVVVCRPFQHGSHAASRALPVTRVDLPAVGSMSLADEQAWLTAPLPWDEPRCVACASTTCPGITGGIDACPKWREAEERADRGEYLTTIPGPVWEVMAGRLGPYGGQLGPRAQLVWDRWDARCRELWGFSPS